MKMNIQSISPSTIKIKTNTKSTFAITYKISAINSINKTQHLSLSKESGYCIRSDLPKDWLPALVLSRAIFYLGFSERHHQQAVFIACDIAIHWANQHTLKLNGAQANKDWMRDKSTGKFISLSWDVGEFKQFLIERQSILENNYLLFSRKQMYQSNNNFPCRFQKLSTETASLFEYANCSNDIRTKGANLPEANWNWIYVTVIFAVILRPLPVNYPLMTTSSGRQNDSKSVVHDAQLTNTLTAEWTMWLHAWIKKSRNKTIQNVIEFISWSLKLDNNFCPAISCNKNI